MRSPHAVVSVYSVDDDLNKLNILKFPSANKDWLHFVAADRSSSFDTGNWDVVCGPVANDQTMPIIDLFLDGMYDEDEAIRRLLPQKLHDQIVFRSEAALSLLEFVEVKYV